MYGYHEERDKLIDLFQRCEATNQMSASMGSKYTAGFHYEFPDYLWSMEQYLESYCIQ